MTRMGYRWKMLAAAAALIGLVGVGALAAAQTPGGGPPPPGASQWHGRHWGPPRGGPMMMFGGMRELRRLDLSDAQRQQIRTLAEQYRKTWMPQLLPLQFALQQAIQENNASAVTNASGNLAAIQLQANLARANLRASILAVLTPTQRQQVAQFEARMNQRMQQRLQRLSGQGGAGGGGR